MFITTKLVWIVLIAWFAKFIFSFLWYSSAICGKSWRKATNVTKTKPKFLQTLVSLVLDILYAAGLTVAYLVSLLVEPWIVIILVLVLFALIPRLKETIWSKNYKLLFIEFGNLLIGTALIVYIYQVLNVFG